MIKRVFLFVVMSIGLIAAGFGVFQPTTSELVMAATTQQRPQHHFIPNSFKTKSLTSGANVLWLNNATWNAGIKLYMSTGRAVDLHNSAAPWDTFQLHAMRPPNGACLEAVVEQGREPDNTMHHYFSLYPWCGPYYDRTYDIEITPAFAANYARTFSWQNWNHDAPKSYLDETLLVKVERVSTTPNCWKALIYNFNTSTWTPIGNPASVCGTPHEPYPAYNTGWQSFEDNFKANTVCGNLGTYHTLQGRDMMYQPSVGAGWFDIYSYEVTFSNNGATRCFPTPWHSHNVDNFQSTGLLICANAANPSCE